MAEFNSIQLDNTGEEVEGGIQLEVQKAKPTAPDFSLPEGVVPGTPEYETLMAERGEAGVADMPALGVQRVTIGGTEGAEAARVEEQGNKIELLISEIVRLRVVTDSGGTLPQNQIDSMHADVRDLVIFMGTDQDEAVIQINEAVVEISRASRENSRR